MCDLSNMHINRNVHENKKTLLALWFFSCKVFVPEAKHLAELHTKVNGILWNIFMTCLSIFFNMVGKYYWPFKYFFREQSQHLAFSLQHESFLCPDVSFQWLPFILSSMHFSDLRQDDIHDQGSKLPQSMHLSVLKESLSWGPTPGKHKQQVIEENVQCPVCFWEKCCEVLQNQDIQQGSTFLYHIS